MDDFLGVNIGGHDSSASHVRVVNGATTDVSIHLSERLTKFKHQGCFPFRALKQLKRHLGPDWEAIPKDSVATNSFQFHPAELEQQFSDADRAMIEFLGLEKTTLSMNPHAQFITHHLCHAYSSLWQNPFEKALIIVSDGSGNRNSDFVINHEESHLMGGAPYACEYLSLYKFEHGELTPLEKKWLNYEEIEPQKFLTVNGLGSLFETASRVIFDDWSAAGKLMGLAAYGKASPIPNQRDFVLKIARESFTKRSGKAAFDGQPPEEFTRRADLAATVQNFFEEQMLALLRRTRDDYPDFENVILTGGCALNCLLNSKILAAGIYKRVFIPPFPNDEGIGLGAAMAIAKKKGKIRFTPTGFERMNPYLGAIASLAQAQQDRVPQVFQDYEIARPQNLTQQVAQLLAKNEIIAWVQGRSEVGPRALGNRSILVRPDTPGIKEKLNEKVKFRESFRPFGATILYHRTSEYFEVGDFFHSPFMTFCPKVRPEMATKLAGVVHHDGTTRIQTLMREQNARFYSLLEEFETLTGLPVLLNTSLNIMGEPILETIEDAARFFRNSAIRTLVFGDYLIMKKDN